MANQKISDRPPKLVLDGTEYVPIIDGIIELKATTQQIGDLGGLAYTAENTANKDTDGTLAANSDVKYASQKAVKTYVDARGITKVKVSVSSAEILALFATPKQLVAAPGAGKLIVPIHVVYYLHYGSIAYATQTELRLTIGAAIDTTADTPLAATNDIIETVTFGSYKNSSANSPNAALSLSVPTANPTAGNSTLDVYVSYIVITI